MTGITQSIALPQGAQATYADGVLTLKGPKGEATRKLSPFGTKIAVADRKITISSEKSTKKDKKLVFTCLAHIKNMCRGVTEGHVYKLRICSGHFPMNVATKGNTIEVKNFIGEKVPRVATLPEGITVKIDAKDITIESSDLEKASQAAGTIEQLTKRVGFDRRIYQDGIYIIEKDGKPV